MTERICIRGGEVFFSENKTIHKKDILISDGKIFRIEDEIQPDGSVRIVNATNKLVTLGLIDFHMHAFRYGHLLSIDTEELSPRRK